MAATTSASPAVVAGAVSTRNLSFVKASRSSVLFGQRMQVLCAGVRLCMTAPGAPEVPAGFGPFDLKADTASPILSGSTSGLPRLQASQEGTVETADAPVDPVAALKMESDILKKKAKKEELRRKRLVRKRHLRKKGRWPPSKMKKLKNV